LRILTIVAACCLVTFFYSQPEPLMTVVYWNIFFVALNAFQLIRIFRERFQSSTTEVEDALEISRAEPI
jgi:hypothetical protein